MAVTPVRSSWIDAGNDARGDLKTRYGITVPYYDARESRLTPTYLDAMKENGGFDTIGIYVAWNWPEVPKTGAGLAQWTHKRLLGIGWRGNAPVHFNSENDDTSYVIDLLWAWRNLRPTRQTGWTMQAHKWPVYAPIAQNIVNANVTVLPQCYVESPAPMTRVESASELDGWQSIGIPRERIAPMLDAGQLGEWWSGTAYTQGRLP